jgi:hypothetical protein
MTKIKIGGKTYDTNKRGKGVSEREYISNMTGISKSAAEKLLKPGSKGSEKKSSSSKDDKAFIEALKKQGGYESYMKQSQEQKDFIKYNYSIGLSDSKEKVQLLSDALKEATTQADPYWKSFLTVAQDEVTRAFDDTKNTYQYQKDELETKIKNISEDLVKNKDFYSLEQQSDLAKLKQSYETQRDTTIEDAANKGLTFSTKREVPLQQLAIYNENVVASTNRGYEKKIGDITTETQRQIDETNKGIIQNQENLQSKLTDIGRTAEQKLGTENLPKLEGYDVLGNVSGDLYKDKVKDIADRQSAIYDEKAQTSLQF